MGEDFERDVKDILIKGTDSAVKHKDRVWENIKNQIETNRQGESAMRGKMRSKKKNRAWSITKAASIAAVIIITIFSVTQPGQAAIGKLREMLAPQKKITENIEGMEEQKNVALQESKMGYIIYIDEEIYVMKKEEGFDRIEPKNKAGNLPEVFMEISQVEGKEPAEVIAEIESDLKTNYSHVSEINDVETPLNSKFVFARTGVKWDDVLVRFYVVDNTKGGSFVIKQQFFIEAEEGHGARFSNMLREFKIVELD